MSKLDLFCEKEDSWTSSYLPLKGGDPPTTEERGQLPLKGETHLSLKGGTNYYQREGLPTIEGRGQLPLKGVAICLSRIDLYSRER